MKLKLRSPVMIESRQRCIAKIIRHPTYRYDVSVLQDQVARLCANNE